MSTLQEMQQYIPRIRLEGAFMEDGQFHIWAEAYVADGEEALKAHGTIAADAGDVRFVGAIAKVIKDLISKGRRR